MAGLVALTLVACGEAGPDTGGIAPIALPGGAHGPDDSGGKADGVGGGLWECTGYDLPFQARSFKHVSSRLVSHLGAGHHAVDVIGTPGQLLQLGGKFTYGPTRKDLEDEKVDVYLDDCAEWLPLGAVRTDRDGRTKLSLPTGVLPGPGVYDVRQAVEGDATQAASQVRVLPAGTRLVVFDIDGTMTTSDGELIKDLFDQVLGGDYVPEAYPGAVDLGWAWAAKGYQLVYLTGRPSQLWASTRTWLADLGFAEGHLHLTESAGQALPTESGVGAYKTAYLKKLQGLGYVIDYAYGNATTDISAYEAAGIAKERTFIIGSHAGERGTVPLADGYGAHVDDFVSGEPDAAQPF